MPMNGPNPAGLVPKPVWMKTILFWIIWMAGFMPWGTAQSADTTRMIADLSFSTQISRADLSRAAKTQVWVLERWHLAATQGWTLSSLPQGKGEPEFPQLDPTLLENYHPFDLELMGRIKRQPDRYARYRVGDTRQILSLRPAGEMNAVLNAQRAPTPNDHQRP